MRRGAHHVVWAMALALALVVASLPSSGDASAANGPPSLATLIPLLRTVRDAYENPGVDLAPAAKRLKDAAGAFAFVRDDVAYLRYGGRMQSAVGTLRSRTGNPLDRVALLGALLEAQGYSVRYVAGDGPPDGARPRGGHRRLGQFAALRKLSKVVGATLASRRKEATAEAKATAATIAALGAEADQATAKLATVASVGGSDAGVPRNDWWWLQARRGKGAWATYDPTYPQVGARARATGRVTPLPDPPTVQLDLRMVHPGGAAESLVSYAGAADGLDPTLVFVPSRADDIARGAAPEQVAYWEPIIQVGDTTVSGRPFTNTATAVTAARGSPPVTASADGTTVAASAPPVSALTITGVDTSRFPEVRVAVHADTASTPQWIAAHFAVSEGTQRKNVRIVEQASEREPIVVVLDRSPSIFDDPAAVATASEALAHLVDLLPPDQRLGLVTLGSGHAEIERKLAPIGDKVELRRRLADDLLNDTGGNETLVLGVSAALDMLRDERGTIVVIGDGDAGGSADTPPLDEVVNRIAHGDDTLSAIGVGSNIDPTYLQLFADAAGTPLVEAPTPAALGRSLDDLAGRLNGRVILGYDAPTGPPGEHRDVSVRVQGFAGVATSGYDVPAAVAPAGPSTLQLRVTLRGASDNPISADRTVGVLGKGVFTGGVFQVFVGLGVYPPDVVSARFFDSWLADATLQRWADDPTRAPPAVNRSVGFTHVRIANQLNTLVDGAAGKIGHPIGPGLALLATEPTSVNGQRGVRTTFDILGFAGGPFGPDHAALARWGLLVTGAEGAVMGVPSTNDHLLSAAGPLRTYAGTPPTWLPEPAASAVRSGDWTAYAPDGVTDAAWLVNDTTGLMYGVTTDGLYLAKGAAAQSVGAQFDQLGSFAERYGYACSAAFGAVGAGPMSVPCSGLIGLFQEDLKLWCFATVAMTDVGEGVESGEFDADAALDEASDLCHIDPARFRSGVAKGVLSKYLSGLVSEAASDRAADAVKEGLGAGSAVRDRVVDATTSAGVDAAKGESPVGDKLEQAIAGAIIP